MANLFLKVNKDLFKLGLNPTEILLLAQVIEYNTNTGDCFISDKTLAEQFGISESTVSRGIKSLIDKGFLTRKTENVKGGRIRHLTAVLDNQNDTTVKMTVVQQPQQSNCLLTTSNLPIDNKQNDFIKDNIKDKEKDKRKESGLDEPSQGDVSSTHPIEKRTKMEETISDVLKISTNTDGSFKM